jgi:hypothetical protein
MREASNRPIYGYPDAKVKPHAKGRICDVLGCATILSTYNASSSCFLHDRPGFPIRATKS